MPKIKMCGDSIFHRHKNSGISRGIPYLIVKSGKCTFLFIKDTVGSDFGFKEYALILLAGITLILACVYLMMRRVLGPIRWLSNGVEEISNGNLEHSIPVLNNDELGRLTSSFNEMSGRILQMLKAKKQLLLDVSHELRSPLTRIKVALEFIPESKTKTSISGDIGEIEIMITELLESERLESNHGTIKKTITPAYNIITRIAEQYITAQPGINVIIPHEGIMIAADPELISMALKNIIENGIKYSLPDGLPVEIAVIEKNHSVIITVTDRGCGIPADELPKVFEPFYRVDRSRSKNTGGYGLGLNLAKKIVEAHGGMIGIESTPGKGTIVTITLPLSQ
jgi:signal transduction histidine kinase